MLSVNRWRSAATSTKLSPVMHCMETHQKQCQTPSAGTVIIQRPTSFLDRHTSCVYRVELAIILSFCLLFFVCCFVDSLILLWIVFEVHCLALLVLSLFTFLPLLFPHMSLQTCLSAPSYYSQLPSLFPFQPRQTLSPRHSLFSFLVQPNFFNNFSSMFISIRYPSLPTKCLRFQ